MDRTRTPLTATVAKLASFGAGSRCPRRLGPRVFSWVLPREIRSDVENLAAGLLGQARRRLIRLLVASDARLIPRRRSKPLCARPRFDRAKRTKRGSLAQLLTYRYTPFDVSHDGLGGVSRYLGNLRYSSILNIDLSYLFLPHTVSRPWRSFATVFIKRNS